MQREPKVEVYSKNWCSYCQEAKALLTRKKIPYIEYDLDKDQGLAEEMKERTGGETTVPQIFIGDSDIGGYDGLVDMERSGRLDELFY